MNAALYLHDIPLDEALERFAQALDQAGLGGLLGSETIPLDEHALGRTLSVPVWARISSPHYHASAMDGFAVCAADTTGAQPSQPLVLQRFRYVDTGDPLPEWADVVIPIEHVEPLDTQGDIAAQPRQPAAIRIRAALPPWSHVRPVGEDIVAGELVLPAGHTLRPFDLGAIAGAGHTSVQVARQPRVAILPTGSELKPLGAPLAAGDIIEYNSLVMAAQVRERGALPTRFPITPDDFALLVERVRNAARSHDLVLLNAGSSAGSEDFSARVVQALGELLVHGVAVRPGHPVILGMLRVDGRAVPIVGVPGYPVSAALTVEIFVLPLLARWQGRPAPTRPTLAAQLTRKVTSPPGDDDYLRVVVGQVGGRTLATPLSRAAGAITSLVRADGLVVLPRGVQGADAGQPVTVQLLRPAEEIAHTVLCIGSHDMTLDLLAQFLSQRGRRLASANVGSLGGILALKRGEAHLAGAHLLDPESGQYNRPYLARYAPDLEAQIISFLEREQGFMVAPNNPKAIRTLQDLTRADVRFVNRQRGAGTRVLLDYHLQQLGIPREAVRGYEHEAYTHLAAAAAVASGRADCALGIPAAARALGLDFVPLFSESYDLITTATHAQSELLKPLFDVLSDPKFRAAVEALPGYRARF
ncbi:MAG: molybdopterin biosynthesis protein [Thermoflexales bacterium]